MYNIFDQLDNLINKIKPINESDKFETEEDYETKESGIKMALDQITDRLLKKDDGPSGGGGGKTEISKSDSPLSDVEKHMSGDGVDKTFKSTEIDGLDDLDSVDVDTDDSGLSLEDDDFEFDDFDYDDKPRGGDSEESGGDGSGSDDSGYEDGDFEDSEMGDEDDYDFGDSDDSYDSESDSVDSTGSSDSDDIDSDDIDYDDTLDYDSKDYDSLESEIDDALERMKEGASSKAERKKLDEMSDIFGDEDDSKSPMEKAEELENDIKKSLNDSESSHGSGELAGEMLDGTPDDKSFEEDMRSAGFDKSEIDKMKKSKDTDLSGEIDEDKIAKEAMEEMDKRASEKGHGSEGSSLSRTIMRNVLKGKITNMEWKEIVGVFLKSKSKVSGSISKSRSTGWGDKKHLWRDAILPKSTPSGGGIDEINCFIDFSGSVSQPLVFSFLQRVLELCSKLTFKSVKVYGFGEKLSKPFIIKKQDLVKDDDKKEKFLNDMWTFIDTQYLGGAIENFEVVAKEILKIKKKDFGSPILIFGDGLWSLSYPNPKPPKYLNELCSRYLKDILVLIYYYAEYADYGDIISQEVGYLRDIVGLKHVVTTDITELK